MGGDPWIYSWKLAISNHSLTALSVDAEIQFKVGHGSTLATSPQQAHGVLADSRASFFGTFALPAETARRVERVERVTVVGTRHFSLPPGQ